MSSISITAALKNARKAVSMPYRFGTNWMVSAPYYSDRLNGPREEIQRNWYSAALQVRKQVIARLALVQMGFDIGDWDADIAFMDTRGTAAEIVTAWIAQDQRGAVLMADNKPRAGVRP